jgi:hypothetical protein
VRVRETRYFKPPHNVIMATATFAGAGAGQRFLVAPTFSRLPTPTRGDFPAELVTDEALPPKPFDAALAVPASTDFKVYRLPPGASAFDVALEGWCHAPKAGATVELVVARGSAPPRPTTCCRAAPARPRRPPSAARPSRSSTPAASSPS